MGRRSRSRSPKRDRRRSRSRDRERRREHRRSRSRSPRRRRSRSPRRRSPERRHDRDRRDRSRDRRNSPEPQKKSKNQPNTGQLYKRPTIDASAFIGKSEEEIQMMTLMGFGSFDTTKGKHVPGNDLGECNIQEKRRYRQYMNRRGGFNRPLDPIA